LKSEYNRPRGWWEINSIDESDVVLLLEEDVGFAWDAWGKKLKAEE
jgi:hypothetical protein